MTEKDYKKFIVTVLLQIKFRNIFVKRVGFTFVNDGMRVNTAISSCEL